MSAINPAAADIKVSVAMVTYNHEPFIAQAIESVLMQLACFEYELVIGEDCSIDATRAIVQRYGDLYPGRIRLLLHERNQGAAANFVATLKACRGRYIAILEGDDFWTSPRKLETQADFLDTHPDCAYCFHDVKVTSEDIGLESWIWSPTVPKEIFTLADLLTRNLSPACSVMYRKGLFVEFPDWYHTIKMGDWALHILNAQHGSVGHVGEVMAVYRRHANGLWSSRARTVTIPWEIEFLNTINRHLNFKYNGLIRLALAGRYYDLAEAYSTSHNGKRVATNLLKSIMLAPFDYPVPKRSILELVIPGIMQSLSRCKQWILPRARV